jgi:hypothetical protein
MCKFDQKDGVDSPKSLINVTRITKVQENMSTIHFNAKPFKIGSWTLLGLPKNASAKLPSRGITMVEGNLNGFQFQAPVEPDGKGSQWFKVEAAKLKAAGLKAGDTVTVAMEPSKEWPGPPLPADLKKALAAALRARNLWTKITPNAQWDWIPLDTRD